MKSFIFFVIGIAFSVNAYSADLKQLSKNSKQPVHITANKLEAFNKQGLYKFIGNVVAVKGDMRLTSKKMNVFKNFKTGEIDKIVCIGNVTITKEDKTAKADKATYEDKNQKITLIGNAFVKSSKNTITSDIIVYYVNRDYAVAQSMNRKKRVEVTIYSGKKGSK